MWTLKPDVGWVRFTRADQRWHMCLANARTSQIMLLPSDVVGRHIWARLSMVAKSLEIKWLNKLHKPELIMLHFQPPPANVSAVKFGKAASNYLTSDDAARAVGTSVLRHGQYDTSISTYTCTDVSLSRKDRSKTKTDRLRKPVINL